MSSVYGGIYAKLCVAQHRRGTVANNGKRNSKKRRAALNYTLIANYRKTTMQRFSFALYFALLASLAATGCWHSVSSDCIKESGVSSTERREPGMFTGVEARGSIEVTLQEGPPSVSIQADEKVIPFVQTRVDGDILTIDFADNVCVNGNVKAIVTAPSVHMLSVKGSGNITGAAPFAAESLSISIAGSGNIVFSGTATTAVSITIAGSGNASIVGAATSLKAIISGSGNIGAFGLPTNDATVSVRGSGNAEVHATQQLAATIAGSGNIVYMGNPTLSTSLTGSGRVFRR